MITESSAKAKRELSRIAQIQRRIEKTKRFESREYIVTPYNLRPRMGKRKGTSSKPYYSPPRQDGAPFYEAAVKPVILFLVPKGSTLVNIQATNVSYGLVELLFIVQFYFDFSIPLMMPY